MEIDAIQAASMLNTPFSQRPVSRSKSPNLRS